MIALDFLFVLNKLTFVFMNIGQFNILKATRLTAQGFYLVDEEEREVLLPNKYIPEDLVPEKEIEVFVYKDSEDRIIATTLIPKVLCNQFACLRVKEINRFGAFLDWGLEKDLLVPYSEQPDRLYKNDWKVVHLYLDEKTDRLVASCKITKFLSNGVLTVAEGDEVNLLISKKTDIGFNVIINNKHAGLIYKNEIFKPLAVGDKTIGYIKRIREDNKLDISLKKQGYRNVIGPDAKKVLQLLEEEGYLSLTDKSSPRDIYEQVEMSKKAFKRAIGSLYKQRLIRLEKDGIYLVDNKELT